jgi:hypothetical protein
VQERVLLPGTRCSSGYSGSKNAEAGEGGEETRVGADPLHQESDQGVLLIDRAQRVLRFFPALTKGQASSREIPGIVSWAGLSLSPDGRWLLVTRLSRATVDVMLIDNFR